MNHNQNDGSHNTQGRNRQVLSQFTTLLRHLVPGSSHRNNEHDVANAIDNEHNGLVQSSSAPVAPNPATATTVVPPPQQPSLSMSAASSSSSTMSTQAVTAPTTPISVESTTIPRTTNAVGYNSDSNESMPTLQSVSDSSEDSWSESDSDSDSEEQVRSTLFQERRGMESSSSLPALQNVDMEDQTQQPQQPLTFTVADTPPGPSLLGASPSTTGRRARVDEDHDEERDRRHPMYRTSTPTIPTIPATSNSNPPTPASRSSQPMSSSPAAAAIAAAQRDNPMFARIPPPHNAFNNPNLFTRLGSGPGRTGSPGPAGGGGPHRHAPRSMAINIGIGRNGHHVSTSVHTWPPLPGPSGPPGPHRHMHNHNPPPLQGGMNPGAPRQQDGTLNLGEVDLGEFGPTLVNQIVQALMQNGIHPGNMNEQGGNNAGNINNEGNNGPPPPPPQHPNPLTNRVTAFLDGVLGMGVRPPPDGAAAAPENGQPGPGGPGPGPGFTFPPGFPFNMMRDSMMLREREDPERARLLVNALEDIPVSLVKRLENVSRDGVVGQAGAEGEGMMNLGDGGCAICWDRLLGVEGGSEEVKMDVEPASSSSATVPSLEESKPTIDMKPQNKTSEPPINRIVALPCAHIFHAECLIPWFTRPRQTTCPTCRFNLDPEGLTEGYGERMRRARERENGGQDGQREQDQQQPQNDNNGPQTQTVLSNLPLGLDSVGARAEANSTEAALGENTIPTRSLPREGQRDDGSSASQGQSTIPSSFSVTSRLIRPLPRPRPSGMDIESLSASPDPTPTSSRRSRSLPPPANAWHSGPIYEQSFTVVQPPHTSSSISGPGGPSAGTARTLNREEMTTFLSERMLDMGIETRDEREQFVRQTLRNANSRTFQELIEQGPREAIRERPMAERNRRADERRAEEAVLISRMILEMGPMAMERDSDRDDHDQASAEDGSDLTRTTEGSVPPLQSTRTNASSQTVNTSAAPASTPSAAHLVNPTPDPDTANDLGPAPPPGFVTFDFDVLLPQPDHDQDHHHDHHHDHALNPDAEPNFDMEDVLANMADEMAGAGEMDMTMDMDILLAIGEDGSFHPIAAHPVPYGAGRGFASQGDAAGQGQGQAGTRQQGSGTGVAPQRNASGGGHVELPHFAEMFGDIGPLSGRAQSANTPTNTNNHAGPGNTHGNPHFGPLPGFTAAAGAGGHHPHPPHVGAAPPPGAQEFANFIQALFAGFNGPMPPPVAGAGANAPHPHPHPHPHPQRQSRPPSATPAGNTAAPSRGPAPSGETHSGPQTPRMNLPQNAMRERINRTFQTMPTSAAGAGAGAAPIPQVAPVAVPPNLPGATAFGVLFNNGRVVSFGDLGGFGAPGPGTPMPPSANGNRPGRPQREENAPPAPPPGAAAGQPQQPRDQGGAAFGFIVDGDGIRPMPMPPGVAAGGAGGNNGAAFNVFRSFFMGGDPHRQRERKAWSLPPAPGASLRQRVEKMEREAGLRCHDVSCGIGPSDDEPILTTGLVRQIAIRPQALEDDGQAAGGGSGSGKSKEKPVCEHTFHPACLVSAERVAWKADEERSMDSEDDIEVTCPVCRAKGVISRQDWMEGACAL